jgi:hypothetical protein
VERFFENFGFGSTRGGGVSLLTLAEFVAQTYAIKEDTCKLLGLYSLPEKSL